MSFIDIVFTALLGYALFTGLKNGLFVEIASFGSLVIGIFVAIKFSHIVRFSIEDLIKINPKYIEIVAFAITFLLVVVGIHLLAKFFTSILSLAYLGWLNKLGGAVFSLLKTVLMLSVVISLFQKININHILVKEETLNNSIFYNPIQEVSKFMYPSLEKWYEEFKEKAIANGEQVLDVYYIRKGVNYPITITCESIRDKGFEGITEQRIISDKEFISNFKSKLAELRTSKESKSFDVKIQIISNFESKSDTICIGLESLTINSECKENSSELIKFVRNEIYK